MWTPPTPCGIKAPEQVAVSVWKCVCHGLCGLSRSIYIPEQSLLFCCVLTFPRIWFLLNDGVETRDIFEAVSQSSLIQENVHNCTFGLEMTDVSRTNTYNTNSHPGGKVKLQYVGPHAACDRWVCWVARSNRLSGGLWKLRAVYSRARGLQFELKGILK